MKEMKQLKRISRPAEKQKLRIAVDTNMLLAIEQFKVNVFEQFPQAEFVAPEHVFKEVQALAGKKNRNAQVAVKVLERRRIQKVLSTAKSADDALLELAKQGFTVATNDQGLRKRIKTVHGKCIYIRKKKLLSGDANSD